MKIIIVSDNHRDANVLRKISETNNADLYLHAGDSGMTEDELKPFITVRGNNDWHRFPLIRIVDGGTIKILVAHGHLHTQKKLLNLAKKNNCQVVVSGHTHVINTKLIDGIYMLNPGSVTYPRGGGRKSYLILTYNNVEDINIKIVYL
jgi:putative phosphoesterase